MGGRGSLLLVPRAGAKQSLSEVREKSREAFIQVQSLAGPYDSLLEDCASD